jgi:hypothetical protein
MQVPVLNDCTASAIDIGVFESDSQNPSQAFDCKSKLRTGPDMLKNL